MAKDGRLAIDVDNERTHRVAEEILPILTVIPAKAGTSAETRRDSSEVPAFAGMTGGRAG